MVDIYREITGPLYPLLDWPMSTGQNGGYNFASGIAGLGIAASLWHRHNCHTDGCWWPVRHGKQFCKRCERRRGASPGFGSEQLARDHLSLEADSSRPCACAREVRSRTQGSES